MHNYTLAPLLCMQKTPATVLLLAGGAQVGLSERRAELQPKITEYVIFAGIKHIFSKLFTNAVGILDIILFFSKYAPS